jgi:GntR family transcriptional regulator, N-acetylglucosamine utilization regulator
MNVIVQSTGSVMATYLHKPLYLQIQEYIAEQIESGSLKPESRIPSERELSNELGVSRMTVRRALTELVNEGLLERVHGAGTFVAKPKVEYAASELVSYSDAIRSRGFQVTRQLLEFDEAPASRRMAERLQVQIGHSLYRVVLLCLANRMPVILERAFFPCERCPDLHEYDLEKTSIYDLLVEAYKIQVTHIDQTIESITASDIVARQLRVDEGFPLLMVTRVVSRQEDSKPVLFSQDLLRGDYARVRFSIQLEENG